MFLENYSLMGRTCCLVLGGYINSYAIVKELHHFGLKNIALIDYGKSVIKKSNRVSYHSSINKSASHLLRALLELKDQCDHIVVFPTDDSHLRFLHEIYDDIKDFCYVPFNNSNIIESLDKFNQYDVCEAIGVPYPKTASLNVINDLDLLLQFDFPILIKPNKKNDQLKVFRTLTLYDKTDVENKRDYFNGFFQNNFTFIASELIPGDDTNIYAYTGFVSKAGKIVNEWIGKKLTQYPDNYGVFSSASNESPEVIRTQGRALLEAMDLRGICEPEFKYDYRDKKYKLTEINLRSMMWNRLGFLDGVALHKSLYNDAMGLEQIRGTQNQNLRVHLVYLKHEILNLLSRKKYWKHFKRNVFSSNVYFALFDKKDLRPFLSDFPSLMKGILKICLRR